MTKCEYCSVRTATYSIFNLYASIVKYYPDRAGKIVGMLLEFDPSELYELVVNSTALREVADDANQMLQAHDAKEQAMSNRTLAEDNDW